MRQRQQVAHGTAKGLLVACELVVGQKDDRIGGIERHPRVDAGGVRSRGPIGVGLAYRCLGAARSGAGLAERVDR